MLQTPWCFWEGFVLSFPSSSQGTPTLHEHFVELFKPFPQCRKMATNLQGTFHSGLVLPAAPNSHSGAAGELCEAKLRCGTSLSSSLICHPHSKFKNLCLQDAKKKGRGGRVKLSSKTSRVYFWGRTKWILLIRSLGGWCARLRTSESCSEGPWLGFSPF